MNNNSLLQIVHYLKAPLDKDPMSGKVIPQSLNGYIRRFGECLAKPQDEFNIFPLDPLGEILDFIYQPLCDILSKPRSIYEKYSLEQVSYKVKQVDMGSIYRIMESAPGRTLREKIKNSKTLPALESKKNYDRVENRAIKHLLKKLFPLLEARLEMLKQLGPVLLTKEQNRINHLKKLYRHSPIKDLVINRAIEPNNVLLFDKNYSRIWTVLKRVEKIDSYQNELSGKEAALLRQLTLFALLSKLSEGDCYWLEGVVTHGKDFFTLQGRGNFKLVYRNELFRINVKEAGLEIKSEDSKRQFNFTPDDKNSFIEQLNKFTDNIKRELFPTFRKNKREKGTKKGGTIGVIPYSLNPPYTVYDGEKKIKNGNFKHEIAYNCGSIPLSPQLHYLIESDEVETVNWIDILTIDGNSSDHGTSPKLPANFISRFAEEVEEGETVILTLPDGIDNEIVKETPAISKRYFNKIKSISHSIAAILWYGKKGVPNEEAVSVIDLLSPIPTVSEFIPIEKENTPLYWRRNYSSPLEERDDEDDGEYITGIVEVDSEIPQESYEVERHLTSGSAVLKSPRKKNILEKHKDLIRFYYNKNKSRKILIITNINDKHIKIENKNRYQNRVLSFPNISRIKLLQGLEEFIYREHNNLISYEEFFPEIKLLFYNSQSGRYDMIKNDRRDTFKPEWGKEYKLLEEEMESQNEGKLYIPLFIKTAGARWEQPYLGIVHNCHESEKGTIILSYTLGEITPYSLTFINYAGIKRKTEIYERPGEILKTTHTIPEFVRNQNLNSRHYSDDEFTTGLELYINHQGGYNGDYFKKRDSLVEQLPGNILPFYDKLNNFHKNKKFPGYYKCLHLMALSFICETDEIISSLWQLEQDELRSLVERLLFSLTVSPDQIERFITEKENASDQETRKSYNNKIKNRLRGMLDSIVILLSLSTIENLVIRLLKERKTALLYAFLKFDGLLKELNSSLITGQNHHKIYKKFLSLETMEQSKVDPVLAKVIYTFYDEMLLNKIVNK